MSTHPLDVTVHPSLEDLGEVTAARAAAAINAAIAAIRTDSQTDCQPAASNVAKS